MFTGIIQHTGKVIRLEKRGDAVSVSVSSPSFFKDCVAGDSIANDGVCLTIEKCSSDVADFCVMHQTLVNTAFAHVQVGHILNLEKACSASALMGGHFVMGHVDSVACVECVTPRETGVEVDLKLPEHLMRYVIRRGSIALNGISLTVAEKQGTMVRVCIIPETLERTNLKFWEKGTLVNVEVDMLGKYMENYLSDMFRETCRAACGTEMEIPENASGVDILKALLELRK